MTDSSNLDRKKIERINAHVFALFKNLKVFSWLFDIAFVLLIISIIIKIVFKQGILFVPMIITLFFTTFGWYKTLKISISLQEYLQNASKLLIFTIVCPFIVHTILTYKIFNKLKNASEAMFYEAEIKKDINYYEEQKMELEEKYKNKEITLDNLKKETDEINKVIEKNQAEILDKKTR